MKTYRINGKEISPIQKLPFKEASLMQEDIIIQQFNSLLEALSDKEEYYDHSKTKMWLVKENGNVEKFEEPKQEECKHNWIGHSLNNFMECTKCGKRTDEPKQEECKRCSDMMNINLQHTCALGTPIGGIGTKQSTSLKEKFLPVYGVIRDNCNANDISDWWLKEIQSHIVKEIQSIDDVRAEDIINIINNLTN